MATATEPITKAAFVAEHLKAGPGLPHAEINKAWQKRGGEGTISGTTFARARAGLVKLGSAVKVKSKPGRKPGSVNKPKPDPTAQADKPGNSPINFPILFRLEEMLDDAVFFALGNAMPNQDEIVQAIRSARRVLLRGSK